MPKRVRDAIRLIKSDVWRLVRTKGSHRQFQHAFKPGTVTVAGKESLELLPKTERSVLWQAGLDKEP